MADRSNVTARTQELTRFGRSVWNTSLSLQYAIHEGAG